ncbi:MAG: hypothetical protein WAV15_00265 [Minisyncoccia bacterium]
MSQIKILNMVQELLLNKFPTVSISNGEVDLKLTSARSSVRICDNHGNHISKPSSQNIDFSTHYIEWMITNAELSQLITQKLTPEEIVELKKELSEIKTSLKDSEFYSRKAQKEELEQRVDDFAVFKYEEIFYSFEKNIDPNLQVKITFKIGDFTLAAHMFVLIGVNNPNIALRNVANNIQTNTPLGSGAKCHWAPSSHTIIEIAKALACSSVDHRDDLILLLS